MKNYLYTLLASLSLLAVSCKVDDIKTYDMKDSAVVFKTRSVQFSMKGVTEEYAVRTLTLDLIGQIADYDRKIDLKVSSEAENTATEGVDFILGEAVMKAGEHEAAVEFKIHELPEGVETKAVTMEIIPNEYFRKGYPTTSQILVTWSEEYVRPASEFVWRWWFNFFCKGYSKNYHKLLVDIFGTDIEFYTNSVAAARDDETLICKLPDWWYAANAQLREYVRSYDMEHPDSPLMHSDDFEAYGDYKYPVGSGIKPERIPTIYETLNSI